MTWLIFTAVYLASVIQEYIFKILQVSSMGNKTLVWNFLPGVICCLIWSQLKQSEKKVQDLWEFVADNENMCNRCSQTNSKYISTSDDYLQSHNN